MVEIDRIRVEIDRILVEIVRILVEIDRIRIEIDRINRDSDPRKKRYTVRTTPSGSERICQKPDPDPTKIPGSPSLLFALGLSKKKKIQKWMKKNITLKKNNLPTGL